MVCRRGIRAPQRSTNGVLGGAGPITWPSKGGETADWRPQFLSGATVGPTRGGFGNHPR